MPDAAIDLACDAGTAVVLAATGRAAPRLDRLAEDLLVAGAQVEIFRDVECDPWAAIAAIEALEQPAIVALCVGDGDDDGIAPLRNACDALAHRGHRVVVCDRPGEHATLSTVLGAMRDLARGDRENEEVLIDLFEEVRNSSEPISATIAVPVIVRAPVVAVAAPRARRDASAWKWGGVAAIGAAALVAAIVPWGDRGNVKPPSIASSIALPEAAALPSASSIARSARVQAEPEAKPKSARPKTPRPEIVTKLPVLELAAQGPAVVVPTIHRDPPSSERPAAAPPSDDVVAAPHAEDASKEDALANAIRRGRAVVVGDLVVHAVDGDRDWFSAMNTCRSRGFWHTSGWRVPTVAELVGIARARVFANVPAWSTQRSARDSTFAVAIAMVSGARSSVDKHDTNVTTICVRPLR